MPAEARAAEALSGWPSNSDESWIRLGVGHGGESDCATRPLAAARPPTTAAADEPSPRECGIALRERTISPACRPLPPEVRARWPGPRGGWRPAEPVRAPSPSTSTRQPGIGCLHVHARRTGSARDRGCRTRARGWHWTLRTVTVAARPVRAGSASPASHSARPDRARRRRRWGRRRLAATGGAPVSAVSGSLSPLPVTVHTTVDPFAPSRRRWASSRPAMLAADAGSTNTPSVRATRW